jgi:hypothetical protein
MLGVARSGAASTAEKTPHREILSGRMLDITTIEVLIYCVQLHVARLLSAYCTSITHAFGIAFARCLGSCLPHLILAANRVHMSSLSLRGLF